MKKIIFSDLDGTLLDHDTYSYKDAEKNLKIIKNLGIPLVFCTSKTRSEIEYWRDKMKNYHPFISENGGGIFIPENYFSFNFDYEKKIGRYYLIRLGEDYEKILECKNDIIKRFDIRSFEEMTKEELASNVGIDEKQAVLAKRRDFDLPFYIFNKNQIEKIRDKAKEHGLKMVSGGRFFHLMGENDKGKAVQILTDLYKKKYDRIATIGIGDSENDFSMLENVDKGYLVKRKDGTHASMNYLTVDKVGPRGWSEIIEKELR
ncbi:MAG: HAD-IIB family hydrolase [Candidatus Thermoplasmatota archaeon]